MMVWYTVIEFKEMGFEGDEMGFEDSRWMEPNRSSLEDSRWMEPNRSSLVNDFQVTGVKSSQALSDYYYYSIYIYSIYI